MSAQRLPNVLLAALVLNACSETTPTEQPVSTPASEPASVAASVPASVPASPPKPKLTVGEMVGEKNGIKVSKLAGSPKFTAAKLFLKSPPFGAKVPSKATFEFEVSDYELGAQTIDEPFLANSGKGQHIHFIIDNGPYMAKYEPKFEVDLKRGSHVILAFLSRSYHESIKHDFVLTKVHVGRKTKKIEAVQLDKSPHLFYSRPKGEYKGDAAKKVLLDFYLANTLLSSEGNKVEATINGEQFILPAWVPYVIEGLPLGEAKIGLRLIDKDGKWIRGPFNKVERTVTLSEG